MPVTEVTDWELVDLGVEHPDYFQGFGCSLTRYENCCYGIGSDANEALDDCLENMAQQTTDCDIEGLEKRIRQEFPDFDNNIIVRINRAKGEMFYHIGIRWN